ncbi:MAG: DUF1080 domain-containing protein [Bacteroidales bacterium]|nr:DUF1080 domain-containing protein [Bacteroidales bacterium]MDY6000963.1 DUF1080 domain-containing protein [Candidatus Cryptobacteroides sp.]
MKKIFTIIASLALVFSVYAQDARQRTTETIVADVLAAMPAQDASQFNEQMKDLAAAAPESIIEIARIMKPAGEGVRNSIYEYALSGVVYYVTDPAHKENATNVLMGLQQAAEACSDAANKAFIESLEMYLKPAETQLMAQKLTVKEAGKLLKSGAIQDKCYAAKTIIEDGTMSQGMKALANALKGDEIQLRNAALGYATCKYGVEALAPMLIKAFPKASVGTKKDLLNWFGNNNVASAESLVSGAMAGDGDIASAAIYAAGKIGGDKLGKELIGFLGGSDAVKSAAALAALKSFKGDIQKEVIGAIGTAPNADGLMNIASTRMMSEAYPVIFKKYQSGDANAAKYLSGVVGTQNIQEIGNVLASAKDNVPQLQNALYSCIHTLAPQEQYAQVRSLIDKASAKDNFYAVLARTGTDAAVEDLEKAYSNGSGAALQGLLGIDNAKAAPILKNIAKSDASKIGTVLPRYIDLVSVYVQDLDVKRFDLKDALELANAKELKAKALNALSEIPTMKAFLLAGQYLDDKDAAYAAAHAVKNIANKTTEEINYDDLKANLEKAVKVLSSTGYADDGYAISEINKMLSEAKPSSVSQLTDEEKEQGFEMLFDGTSLDKFHGDKEGYTPVNGAILVSANYGSTGNLYTLNEYRNFVLRFEFCFTKEGANNGVGVRTPMGVDAAYNGMCEVQILDHDAPMYANLHEYQVHGSVYGVIPAKRIKHKALGEWETEEIRVEGNHIKVTVNGEVIVDGDVRKACKGHNVAPDGGTYNPYTVDHKNHPGMFNKKGYVSFCGHGEGLKLRNVRILDLGDKK